MASIRDYNGNNVVEYEYDPYYTVSNKEDYEYTNTYDKVPTRKSTTTYLQSYRLRKIKYGEGSIEFIPSEDDRKDVSVGQKYLAKILIKDTNNNLIKQFNFIYTYNDNIPINTSSYGVDTKSIRLRLSEIQQVDLNNNIVSYLFKYNSFNLLPSRDSYNYDHWGFANGSYNSRPDPKRRIEWYDINGKKNIEEVGIANRESNIDKFNYTQAGLLTKVIYPTKGFLEVQYEPHIADIKKEFVIENRSALLDYYDDYDEPNTVNIEIKGPEDFKSTVHVKNIYWRENVNPIYYGPTITFTDLDNPNNKYTIESIPNFRSGWSIPCENCTGLPFDYPRSPKELPPGRYRIDFKSNPQYRFGATITWSNKIEREITEIYGGTRVKKISLGDSSSSRNIEKSYLYTTSNNKSSAVLISKPLYESPTIVNVGNNIYVANGVKLYCNPYNAILSDSRYHVGYSSVTEVESSNDQENGESIYKFTTSDTFKDLTAGYIIKNRLIPWVTLYINGNPEIRTSLPPNRVESRDNIRGLLTNKIVYKVDKGVKKKLQSIHNMYYYQAPQVTLLPPYDESYLNEEVQGVSGIYATRFDDFVCYDFYQTGKLLSYSYDTLYQDNNYISSKTINQYNSKFYTPSKIMKEFNRDNKREEIIQYPFSVEDNHVLYQRNVLYVPLKTQLYAISGSKQTKIHETINKYSSFPTSGYHLSSTESIGLSNNFVSFQNYDKWGNIILYIDKNNLPIVYLWSYGGQYPIAEIKNATFTEVSDVLNSVFSVASIDDLSEQLTPNEAILRDGSLQKALSNALVTTYTYKPLVGILTATDPSGITTYYEYDSFGRLKETYIYKDNIVSPVNKQIIQEYKYHYQNQ